MILIFIFPEEIFEIKTLSRLSKMGAIWFKVNFKLRRSLLQKECYEHVSFYFSTFLWHWASDKDAHMPPCLRYDRFAERHQRS